LPVAVGLVILPVRGVAGALALAVALALALAVVLAVARAVAAAVGVPAALVCGFGRCSAEQRADRCRQSHPPGRSGLQRPQRGVESLVVHVQTPICPEVWSAHHLAQAAHGAVWVIVEG
jgi:hypothetical protein